MEHLRDANLTSLCSSPVSIGENLFLPALIALIVVLIAWFYIWIHQDVNIVKDVKQFWPKFCADPLSRWEQCPPCYPNGWIAIAETHQLKAGDVKSISALGRDLVAYRSKKGEVFVVDAYCPHLGAHLGVGGKIVQEDGEDCLQCPFHKWTFRGRDGLCVRVPYSATQQPPMKVQIKSWKVVEANGYIFIWHHADDEEPNWEMIKVPQIDKKEWIYGGRTEHTIICHFQEIPENGADVAHLPAIHENAVVLGGQLDRVHKYPNAKKILFHEWTPSWQPGQHPEKHLAYMTLKNRTFFCGIKVIDLMLDVTQVGPACVILRYKVAPLNGLFGIWRGTLVQAVTPIAPFRNKVVHQAYVQPTMFGRLMGKFMLHGEAPQFERDIYVWNNKKYLKNPILVREERSISQFRRWFPQFYSPGSEKYSINNEAVQEQVRKFEF